VREKRYSEEASIIMGDRWEDFMVRGAFSVTALNLVDGMLITYSRNPDFYQFRALVRKNGRVHDPP
jgi:hypothetical protein